MNYCCARCTDGEHFLEGSGIFRSWKLFKKKKLSKLLQMTPLGKNKYTFVSSI